MHSTGRESCVCEEEESGGMEEERERKAKQVIGFLRLHNSQTRRPYYGLWRRRRGGEEGVEDEKKITRDR